METYRDRDITGPQAAVLSFCANTYQRTQFYPTYREILSYFGWSPNSINYVWEIMVALERKGFIAREKNRRYRII